LHIPDDDGQARQTLVGANKQQHKRDPLYIRAKTVTQRLTDELD
jgi:hypothetical protein